MSGFDDSSWISVLAPSMGQCGPNPVGGGITENGVQNISVKTAYKVAHALGVKLSDLFDF